MQKFLSSLLKYLFLNIIIVTVLIIIAFFIFSNASFKISHDKHILVIGDSHTESAVDDVIFSHSVNVSHSGTAYLYSYIKLRKFLAENAHVDTVLVSFHGGSIQKNLDELVVGEEKILMKLPYYIFLLQAKELLLFISNTAFYSSIVKIPIKQIRGVVKFTIKHALTYEDLYIGGYLKLNRDKLGKAIEIREKNNNIENEYSEYQLEYLLKIVDLCAGNNVRLILFNTPTYNPKKYGNLSGLNNYYSDYFNSIKYLDFSSFPLPDLGYGDIEHLNFRGAEIFSRYLEDNYEELFNRG